MRKHSARVHRASLYVLGTTILLSLALIAAAPARARSDADDPGAAYEHNLNEESHDLFGFGQPVANSANTPSNTEPGNKAVSIAKGLSVKVVSDKVGENADMIALWPNDDKPTYAIICNEIDGTLVGAAATVQRVRLSDGQVSDMISGMVSCDPAHRTDWGTIIVGEEAGTTGRLWEILDPLNVAGVTVDRAGT